MEYIKRHGEILGFSLAFLLIGILGMSQNARNDRAIGADQRLSSFNSKATAEINNGYMAIQSTKLDYDLQPTEYESSNPQLTFTGYVLQAQPINNSRFQGSYSSLQNAYVNSTE